MAQKFQQVVQVIQYMLHGNVTLEFMLSCTLTAFLTLQAMVVQEMILKCAAIIQQH